MSGRPSLVEMHPGPLQGLPLVPLFPDIITYPPSHLQPATPWEHQPHENRGLPGLPGSQAVPGIQPRA